MTLNVTGRLRDCIRDFKDQRVLVVGDAILDEYLVGECGRLSPEAPVPVLRVNSTRRVLGGAANTAANVVSLGGSATLIAFVGADEGGATLKRCAADAGVDLVAIDHGLPTLRKTRVVGQQQQIVRLDYEDGSPAGSDAVADVLAGFDELVDGFDIVVISDYAKGVVSPVVAHAILDRAHAAGLDVIVDPRPQHRDLYKGCDYLTPNWREARALLGLPDGELTPGSVRAVTRALGVEFGANIVLTLGAQGIAFRGKTADEEFAMPTLARDVFDVSGAGDTVVAAFALARAAGADHNTAVTIANKAASIVVGKFGTATVTADEMLEDTTARRLVARNGLAPLAASLRASGKRIVTINGSFDILHSGHLYILNEARQRGDVLIVGLNSDASVKGYKGPDRPIVPERGRAEMLLSLRMVDYVHVFDEPDPRAFLQQVKPDVHVNGAEYGEDCIERETVIGGGGQLHVVDRIGGLSTTGILNAGRPSGVQVMS
jgi:D-beta-D-heptose 7-phosphate kinase/D-beta-D-heptose 1-phosphate adenosyltransferase